MLNGAIGRIRDVRGAPTATSTFSGTSALHKRELKARALGARVVQLAGSDGPAGPPNVNSSHYHRGAIHV